MNNVQRGVGRYRWVALSTILSIVLFCGDGVHDATGQGEVVMTQISTDTTRPHQVQAGAPTTFVIMLRNPGSSALSVNVSINSDLPGQQGWIAVLSVADSLFRPASRAFASRQLTLQGNQVVALVATVLAPVGLADGVQGRATVTAQSTMALETLDLTATVRNQPKVFLVAMDGCGGGNLYLDRRGNWDTGVAERLMPRARQFIAASAFFPNASGLLPSVTDPNHVAALTGSWPGTIGVPQVFQQYAGIDPETGNPIYLTVNKNLLRWGADGAAIQSIYDVLQNGRPPQVPNTDLYNIHFSGKESTGQFFNDGLGTVDMMGGGIVRPYYVSGPQPRVLGDPPSDANAATDRDGTNIVPPESAKLYQSAQVIALNQNPTWFPSDRWIMDASLRMLFAEDPDVFYINMGDCDDVQHYMGAADRPSEWIDPGTPDVLWDDSNVYNRYVNRDAVLDVIYEADFLFGRFLDAIETKQLTGKSVVVLLADHGQVTMTNAAPLNLGQILQNAGYTQADLEMIIAVGSLGYLYLTDPALSDEVEASLEGFTTVHPVTGATVNPFIVIDRAEMDSGIDSVIGQFGGDGIAGNRRGEMYSEWNIDYPVTGFSKVRWPDLWIFTRDRLELFRHINPLINGGVVHTPLMASHGTPESSWIPLALRGPGIRNGVYNEPVTLVDVAPTLYHLLDLPQPDHVDGQAIMSALLP